MTCRLVVVGGGVIGRSIAWEAVTRGFGVTLIERNIGDGAATWASAGILPYAHPETARDPLDRLAAISHELHQRWYAVLSSRTNIDYELQFPGTVHLARTRAEHASLLGLEDQCRQESIPCTSWNLSELRRAIPSIGDVVERGGDWRIVYRSKDGQLRPPRLAKALRAALASAGATMLDSREEVRLQESNGRIAAVIAENRSPVCGDHVCVAAGAWSGQLLKPIGVDVAFVPIRGQMVYFQLPTAPFAPTVYEGGNYLVPRRDGGLLVGSTLEDVGFEPGSTPDAIQRLSIFAASVVPDLDNKKPGRVWSGLRPATFDGLPYVGAVPGFENLWLAAGHYRSGVHLAPVTAVGICDQIEGRRSEIDWTPFRPARG